jgi:phage N-6-adenine-methyltransferase
MDLRFGRLTYAMFSSATDEWETPQDIYDDLNQEFKFSLDPCCTLENMKTIRAGYTKADDGLKQDWSFFGSVFMNPPYGSPQNPCKPVNNGAMLLNVSPELRIGYERHSKKRRKVVLLSAFYPQGRTLIGGTIM